MGPAAGLVLLLLALGSPEAKRTAGKSRRGRGRLERALGGYGETAPRGGTPRLGERKTLSRAVVSYGTSAWNSRSIQKQKLSRASRQPDVPAGVCCPVPSPGGCCESLALPRCQSAGTRRSCASWLFHKNVRGVPHAAPAGTAVP